VDALPTGLEHFSDRVLGQPVDFEVGSQAAQLVGDGDVTLDMAEPDRRRDVERTLTTVPGTPLGY
jgi:hypothetical protein